MSSNFAPQECQTLDLGYIIQNEADMLGDFLLRISYKSFAKDQQEYPYDGEATKTLNLNTLAGPFCLT